MSFLKRAFLLLRSEPDVSPWRWIVLLSNSFAALLKLGIRRRRQGFESWLMSAVSGAVREGSGKASPALHPQMLGEARAVDRLMRGLSRCVGFRWATCLFRSLASKEVLERRGTPVRLAIGAQDPRESEEALAAHAWIEVCGEPIGEGAEKLSKYEEIGPERR